MYLGGNRRWVPLWHVHISPGKKKIEITSVGRCKSDAKEPITSLVGGKMLAHG